MKTLADFGLVPHECSTIKPGDVFGRLTVVAVGKPPSSYRYKVLCTCTCGRVKAIRMDALRSGATLSCGCYHKTVSTKHGLYRHPLYHTWRHMVSRCTDRSDSAYHNYGGRGIEVCERWMSIQCFVSDMEPGFKPGLELDRIDNDGPYAPENCRWATPSENCDNRRGAINLTYSGKTQSLARWSEELGIAYGTLRERVCIWNWDAERALATAPIEAPERMRIAREARWGKPEK